MRYLLLFLLALWPLARAVSRPELPDRTAGVARRLVRGLRPRRAARPRRYARPGPALPFVVSGPADLLRLVAEPRPLSVVVLGLSWLRAGVR
ncbi:hypothetical protein KIK06_21055 [Nocardiopsis sp. EMB25]|uniref:hypothetical protein n=1 Tax=Nocardiopsis sp. EMB25 TaxID=2835867 RepID=UPI002284E6D9|nr:hypothetical protein [Nocardiopsis sp. EMB25]MCY9786387.1 hypothetical protein [Nocardiopsis sp. EMB25]